jgi:hypothetical protein
MFPTVLQETGRSTLLTSAMHRCQKYVHTSHHPHHPHQNTQSSKPISPNSTVERVVALEAPPPPPTTLIIIRQVTARTPPRYQTNREILFPETTFTKSLSRDRQRARMGFLCRVVLHLRRHYLPHSWLFAMFWDVCASGAWGLHDGCVNRTD